MMLKKTMLGLLKIIPPHITKTILEAWHQIGRAHVRTPVTA